LYEDDSQNSVSENSEVSSSINPDNMSYLVLEVSNAAGSSDLPAFIPKNPYSIS